ncbi:hypothetical protein GGX14DRAFT_667420 [Mycena pura]|uniref:Ig-like domain-containing protein n=1 Tax=Mycena pura TaxID=153505 RepID=A0AAD6V0H5_9AGAR|nr:hypothetical protein GGX14DRAFT_667420 [Mycena pura]
MKFISTPLFTLALAAFAVANPLEVEKRSEACVITGAGSRCRRSPNTSSDIIGEFQAGKSVTFSCTTTGPSVSGNTHWDRTTIGGVQCFVSDSLVAGPCPVGLPACVL